MPSKRAKYVITGEALRLALNFPTDVDLTHIEYERDRNLVYLYFTGENLEEIPEGQEAPETWYDPGPEGLKRYKELVKVTKELEELRANQ